MAQLPPLPSNHPQSASASAASPALPPPGKCTVLQEQLELTMVAPSKSRSVAVYCAASFGNQKAFQKAAVSLGHALVAANRPLVYGGGNSGIMGIVSSAVANLEGGKVTGIIPYAILAAGGEKDQGNGQVRSNLVAEVLNEKRSGEIETIVVNSMHERKIEMAKRVGAFVGLPGGFGTFEEILEVVTWNQLNIHNKPVIVLNVLSYYNPLRDLIKNGIREGFIRPQNEKLVVFVEGPADPDEHEDYDWGTAALKAIDAWEHDKVSTLPFHWTKGAEGASNGSGKAGIRGAMIPGLHGLHGVKLTNGWFKRVWHVRSRSDRI
ncbi:hypothetical protein PAXRUDRAFT_831444 [Paxillus rubicundulus Ve08.2h10]|uniref:Cytokinin riboside 5'-monophosphate phosphoribohydrolase n=1 Tax=Paxillus rubicundulus Ve08.2h10 TaxID=930991 RepID=A0A0D0E1X7_9AGAM|nr:hypothetical protein PAXRUDRAFT_831444 [Paxillus rubicundulus Ve08.2h10]